MSSKVKVTKLLSGGGILIDCLRLICSCFFSLAEALNLITCSGEPTCLNPSWTLPQFFSHSYISTIVECSVQFWPHRTFHTLSESSAAPVDVPA